jgi:pheromone shutdown-related protein TraB
MPNSVRIIELRDKKIALVGTAHISPESVEEVRSTIASSAPDRVCIELDQGRYATMSESQSWEKLDIVKVLKEGKGFLMLANLVLSSFQRRMGTNVGLKPGDEMRAAVDEAQARAIPYSLCDREIQVTLRRAWTRSGPWSKAKLMASLIASTVSNEELKPEEIEKLKDASALDEMMSELADYLPSVKEVLIDERDRFLATKIYQAEGKNIVAVVGAGHREGIEAWLRKLDSGEAGGDLSDISSVPPKGKAGALAGWIVPGLLLAMIVYGFIRSGVTASLGLLAKWLIIHGVGAALGSILALASPLTILVSFAASPVVVLKPFLSIGLVAALVEAWARKPQVSDFESLSEDILSIKGFYKNKITKILLVFFLASLGGAIGNFVSLPIIGSLVL